MKIARAIWVYKTVSGWLQDETVHALITLHYKPSSLIRLALYCRTAKVRQTADNATLVKIVCISKL